MGCQFQVDFYNYGTGDFDASVNFAQHAPTQGDVSTTQGSPEVSIGEDRPGGGTDLDGEETYELAFTGDPHPKQGYHVKLTINAPYSQGADTKHKVFWVEPCDAPDEENPGEENPGEDNPGEDNPGEDHPGEDNPGEDNPGEDIPGEEIPGEESPSAEIPGEESPSAENPSAENPSAEVPGVIPPDGSGELPGTSTTPPGSSSQSSSSTSSSTSAGTSSTSAGTSSTSAGTSADSAGESAAPVPTAVDAGLGATDRSTTEPALATGLLGLGGLVTAGVAMATRRRRATD